MLKTPIYHYYAFGYNYSLIRHSGLLNYDKTVAMDMLDNFHGWLDSLDLRVTQKIASNLLAITEELRASTEAKVVDVFSERIKSEVKRLDSALDAELQLRTAYVMTKKRYPLKSLLDTPESLLGTGVHARLSPVAQRDYGLACRQIALSQPTAAAFHLMRALEQQVKMLYFGYKKTKRL